MRTLLAILCCFSLSACSRPASGEATVVHLPSEPTPVELAFVAALTHAFEQKDADQFVRLSHWKVSEGKPLFYPDFYAALIARGCRSITLTRVDPKLATERIESDSRVRESLSVCWIVTIEHPTNYESHTDMNAGLDGGSIKLTTSYVVKTEPNPESCVVAKPTTRLMLNKPD